MYRKIILTACFIFSSLATSQAAQDYAVSIVNQSKHKIYIMATPGQCMKTWNTPSDWTAIDINSDPRKFSITDKNSGNCINSEKSAYWLVKQDNLDGENSLLIGMEHTRPNSHTWRTALTGAKNPLLDIELSGGYCGTTSGVVSCLNNAVDNVKNGDSIEFVIGDSSQF